MKVDDGINPAEAKRAEAAEIRLQAELKQRETEKAFRTFNYVSALWFDERARSGFWSKNAVGEEHTMRFLTNYIRPVVGKVPISELNAHHVFDGIIPTYQSKPNTAEKCLTIISSVWKWSKANTGHQVKILLIARVRSAYCLSPIKTTVRRLLITPPWRPKICLTLWLL